MICSPERINVSSWSCLSREGRIFSNVMNSSGRESLAEKVGAAGIRGESGSVQSTCNHVFLYRGLAKGQKASFALC